MRKTLLMGLAVALPLALLAGCGDNRPTQIYKQGTYQGKPDTRPWDNEQFKGSQKAWEDAVKSRAQAQNEYVRMGDGPGGKL